MTSEIHEVKRTSQPSLYHLQLLNASEQWLDERFPNGLLLSDYREAAHAKWWSGAEWTPEPADAVSLYILASTSLVGEGKINSYIAERHTCNKCGDSYRIENLQVCVLCGTKLCYKCHNWADVGRFHRCGGELV